MKKKLNIEYVTPEAEVLLLDIESPLLAESSIGNSSSEGFQDEGDFPSIWG
ncbi:MAG: hypothetical protein IK045_01230 [Bacteroidales bacterium]|nr:hypothetical protein [Bacteroidales bacterium]